jgi:hypothetical protein
LLVALTIVWAAWAGWSLLGRATPYELRVLDDLGAPVASAVADVDGNQVGTSGSDGRIQMEWNRSSVVLEVSAPGHVAQMLTIAEPPESVLDVVIKARVLRGRVVDPGGQAVDSAVVMASPSSGMTDSEGRFNIRGAEPGEIAVEKPAWLPASFTWDGGPGEVLVEVAPFIARAVHMSGPATGERLDEFITLAETTELNALMVDLKDDRGRVWYNTANAVALEVGAPQSAYNLNAVATAAHNEGLYLIGRLVVFSDEIAAWAKPSMAVWDVEANAPYSLNGQFFLDPTDPEARQYGLDLAAEACSMGVDEIQFDYIRLPDTLTEFVRFDVVLEEQVRMSTIPSFLAEAVALLHPMGCAVGADVFGFITTDVSDGYIGQRWEDVAQVVDVISPMVYPSHYGPGWFGYDVPNDNPGQVVRRALEDGMERLPRNVVVRPWLQDFGYGPAEVKAQIASAEGFGLGWMLWNELSEVTTDALRGIE